MRFAASAFGLAMLTAQCVLPGLVQAQQQRVSPVYAWPAGLMQVQAVQDPQFAAPQIPAPIPAPQAAQPQFPQPQPLQPGAPQPQAPQPQAAQPQAPQPQAPLDPGGLDATTPPPALPPSLPPASTRPSLGAVAGAFSSAPNIIGDNFGITPAAPLQFRVRAPNSTATIISGAPGDPFSVLTFDADGNGSVDTTSVGPGQLLFGEVVFQVAEPALGNILAGPDASCFRFVEGTASSDDPAGFSDPWDLELIYQCDAISISTAGSSVGRIKAAEDVSPIPRDRLFFNYSLFTDVPLTGDGISVNRFTLGTEAAFADDIMSVELRLPMAVTLDSTYEATDPDISKYEFGDLYLAAKYLFYECNNRYMSAGLSLSLPTAKDSQVFLNNDLLARIDNRSVRVAPFIGALAFNDLYFAQGFIQVDVDVSGDDVMSDPSGTGTLTKAGTFQDPTLLYLDLQVGAWLLRDTRPTQRKRLRGLASIFELHYNRNLNDLDSVDVPAFFSAGSGVTGTFVVGDPEADIDVLNALAGIVLDFRGGTNMAVTYGLPLTNDKQFDSEVRVTLNRFL